MEQRATHSIPATGPGTRALGVLGAAWGTLGVMALLIAAVLRLAPRAYEAWAGGLSSFQWVVAAAFAALMAWAEGYRGFQTRFSPRTAARIRYLRDHPAPVRSLLAPLFAMGLFHAPTGTKLRAWGLTAGIVVLIVLLQRVAQPWRGIVDAGVVIGLTWGAISLGWSVRAALTRPGYAVSPELPD